LLAADDSGLRVEREGRVNGLDVLGSASGEEGGAGEDGRAERVLWKERERKYR